MFRKLASILTVALLGVAGLVGGAAPASAVGAALYCVNTPEGRQVPEGTPVHVFAYTKYGWTRIQSIQAGNNGCASLVIPDAYRYHYIIAGVAGWNGDTGHWRWVRGYSPIGAPGLNYHNSVINLRCIQYC
ncbi:hypothetical protein QFZ33_000778 [Arthrobacter globiformis]|nr:hypothetical protein [Arthrobacter globiformis]